MDSRSGVGQAEAVMTITHAGHDPAHNGGVGQTVPNVCRTIYRREMSCQVARLRKQPSCFQSLLTAREVYLANDGTTNLGDKRCDVN